MTPARSSPASVHLDSQLSTPISEQLRAAFGRAGLLLSGEGAGAVVVSGFRPLSEAAAEGGGLRVALVEGRLTGQHAVALRRDPPALLLACREPGGGPAAWELRALLALLTGAPLLPSASGVELEVGQVKDLRAAAEQAVEVVRAAGGSRSAADIATDVMHELAANALFDAPVGPDGRPRYAHRRGGDVDFAREDACRVEIQVADGRVYLSATDRFGRLTAAPFASAVGGLDGRARVNSSGGGAGLGLRRMVDQSDLIAVRVRPGQRCQVVCAVDLGEARRRSSNPKSLLFYLERG